MTDVLSPTVAAGEFTPIDKFIFESWGYFVIPDVLSSDEVAACYDASARLHAQRGKEFGQLGRGYEVEPSLERLIDHPAVLPKSGGCTATGSFCKPAGTPCSRLTPERADGTEDGSSAYDFKQLGYPVPLIQLRASYLLTDQSLPRMGNMELIPGSHRSLVGLPDEVRSPGEDVSIGHVILASAGSVLVFHNAVWHRTYAHDGDRDRYTAHYIYSPPWVRQADRLQNSLEFLERTTPLRRALMGEFARPDAPFGVSYEPLPFS